MLPDNYHYKFIKTFEHDHAGSYHCTFRLKLESKEDARKWVADYNDKTKETMVYERSETQCGKQESKSFTYVANKTKDRQGNTQKV